MAKKAEADVRIVRPCCRNYATLKPGKTAVTIPHLDERACHRWARERMAHPVVPGLPQPKG